MIVDAHHHFWDRTRNDFDYRWQNSPEMQPICRNFLPSDLKPLLEANGVNRTVVVQTQHRLEENEWALELAEQNDFIAGVVGWVDLASPDCEVQLLRYKDHPKFVGVRHVTQDEPDVDFIVREDVVRGLQSLERHRMPFDLLFYVKHLRHAVPLARKLPELPMVIDHLAKPEIKRQKTDNWRDPFVAASRFENVYCKLSGMITEADWRCWSIDDLKYYVDTALDAFGPERLMFGSDWPVCLLAGTYQQAFDALRELIAELSTSEQAAILGETAIRFYGLSRA